jgi:hypothetical protein
MRRTSIIGTIGFAFAVTATFVVPVGAQGLGVPGAPVQRMGPSRGPGNGLGTPGAPMQRLGGRSGAVGRPTGGPPMGGGPVGGPSFGAGGPSKSRGLGSVPGLNTNRTGAGAAANMVPRVR